MCGTNPESALRNALGPSSGVSTRVATTAPRCCSALTPHVQRAAIASRACQMDSVKSLITVLLLMKKLHVLCIQGRSQVLLGGSYGPYKFGKKLFWQKV